MLTREHAYRLDSSLYEEGENSLQAVQIHLGVLLSAGELVTKYLASPVRPLITIAVGGYTFLRLPPPVSFDRTKVSVR